MALFLSSLISAVVDKTTDSRVKQLCQMWGIEFRLRELQYWMSVIQSLVADADEWRGASDQLAEHWVMELRAAMYEAVDMLDDFQYEALRQKAIREQPSSSAKVVKDFFSSDNVILSRQKISVKLTKVLGKIREILIEMDKLGLFWYKPEPIRPLDRETRSFVLEFEVYGRDSDKEKIVNALLDSQRERENISVLPIIGMAGLGKTTLAQLVYNDSRVKEHFQLFVWVFVSTEFNIIDIMKSIIYEAKGGKEVSTSSKEVLHNQLREILNKKRYLLVLDDVWNEDIEKWNELKTLLFFGASTGSVVIVTTQSNKVALIMGTLPSHNLTSLTEEDSWTLFKKRAFVAWNEEPSEELIAIGRTIVHKCAGLPLAVKEVGILMATKLNVHDWRAIVECKIWEVLASSVEPVLKLSYDHLPQYIQQCFAFCAVFPEDSIIERDMLIQLWIANDIIPTDDTMDLEDKGQHIFNELCLRFFFKDVREEEGYYGSIITCKMHNLMHGLATHVTQKNFSSSPMILYDLEMAEVEHLSLPNESLKISILSRYPNIRILWVSQLEDTERSSHLLKSSNLRALKFKSGVSAIKELGYMRYLRYLDLSYGGFEILPESVSMLYHLRTLNLSHSSIHKLPEGMRYMFNLRNLLLNGCTRLKWMPIGLGKLRLKTLTKYIVDPDRGVSITELKNLNNLGGHLSLSGLEKVRDKRDAEEAKLVEKPNLFSLELEWDDSIREAEGIGQAVLEALKPHSSLKFLYIIGFSGSTFPNWIKDPQITTNLKRLWLIRCINCAELPPLWQMPLLEELSLWKMDNLKFFVDGTFSHADGSEPSITFPNLNYMDIYNLPNLEGWNEGEFEFVNFPNLNKLRIRRCPNLKSVPMNAPLLEKLEVSHSNKIKVKL